MASDDSVDFDPREIAYVPTTGVHKVFETPLVQATAESLKGYGQIVESPTAHEIEIVRWPAQGWRPVDENSGDQGGVTEGLFEFWWKGDTLYARNNAVGDSYLFAWSQYPEEATSSNVNGAPPPRERALIWRANYHPDGGQLFYPMDDKSRGFVIPLALPGDDVTPEKFVAFRCDGGKGLYIHPGIWHGAVVPVNDNDKFLDRQGRVHARISVDFAKEFGGYLSVSLHPVLITA
jgi:ureidoglycolate lyase